MAKVKNVRDCVPELWSEQVIKQFQFDLGISAISRRSKGERLLRAAAQGASQEELAKIESQPEYVTTGELYEYLTNEWTNDAADVLRYSIDADIMGRLSTGARKK